ncbi:MAG: M23 family metallopeptidase [Terricaulis sp.]
MRGTGFGHLLCETNAVPILNVWSGGGIAGGVTRASERAPHHPPLRLGDTTCTPGDFLSGLDIGAFAGAPIVATAPGIVVFAGNRGAPYGSVVEIDHGHGFKTRYAGLSDAQVRRGDNVAVGQRIGSMGATAEGHRTCLHYEVWFRGRAVEPINFLRAGRVVYYQGS